MFGLPLGLGAPIFGLSPKLWMAAGAILMVILVGLSGYGYGYGSGKADAAEKAAEALAEQTKLLAEANERNRQQEKAHEREVADLRASFAQQQADAQARDARTIADLRSGNDRLRFKVSSCATPKPGPAGTASGGTDGTRTAELAPETAAALWAIARDGDRAIRKLTALQAWAKSAVKLCGADHERLPQETR